MPSQISRILSCNNNFRSSLCKSLPAAVTTSRGLVGGLIQHKQPQRLEQKHRKFAAVALKGKKKRRLPQDGVTLHHFLAASSSPQPDHHLQDDDDDDDKLGPSPTSAPLNLEQQYQQHQQQSCSHKTIPKSIYKFHLKTYGCQMNVNDSDIIRSILLKSQDFGILFEETQVEMDAHVLLTNTCAIRENAENKVWQRLQDLRAHDAKHPLDKMINNATQTNTNDDSISFPGLQNRASKQTRTKKRGTG